MVRHNKSSPKDQHQKHLEFVTRDIKKIDINKFNEDLNNVPWDSVFTHEDTDDMVESWYKLFYDALNKVNPKISSTSRAVIIL